LILFPGRDSVPVGSIAPAIRTLIVLDASWKNARGLWRNIRTGKYADRVARCTKVHVNTQCQESIYEGLRREPEAGFVSTLEAIGFALSSLERPEINDALCRVFRAMVGKQKEFLPPKSTRPPSDPAKRLVDVDFREDNHNVKEYVLAYNMRDHLLSDVRYERASLPRLCSYSVGQQWRAEANSLPGRKVTLLPLSKVRGAKEDDGREESSPSPDNGREDERLHLDGREERLHLDEHAGAIKTHLSRLEHSVAGWI